MRPYRLLIDFEVIETLNAQKRSVRAELRDCFVGIWNDPSAFIDYTQSDSSGRPVHVHIFLRFAIEFWVDHADRQIKIVGISPADSNSH